jgi:PleD family two-component response regulator
MVQKVLIIDDSKTIHAVVKSKLSHEPIEFHSAFNGTVGLQVAAALQPDLILLDIARLSRNQTFPQRLTRAA